MGSKVSTARRPTPANIVTARHPTPANTVTAVIPELPQEIIDEILGHLATNNPPYSAIPSLRSCSLVCNSWVSTCQRHLFYTVIFFTSRSIDGWVKAFPVPEESPAHRVRDLCVWIGGRDCVREEEIFGYTLWFKNVEKISLFGYGSFSLSRAPSSWRLPQSVTSLIIKTNVFTHVDIRDILAQLPNLNNLSLSGYVAGSRVSPVIGTALRGRFGGQLELVDGPAHEDVMNMLLEIPTGLHFTELQIFWARKSLLSTMRLAEACGETLVKLSYSTSVNDQVKRSFDFSKLPNIQKVDFGVSWVGGGLLWIPSALSTIKPATSSNLSAIRLNFALHSTTNRPIGTLLNDVGSGLHLVADEFSRIEREFGGAVNLTVVLDPAFKAVLGTFGILRRYAR